MKRSFIIFLSLLSMQYARTQSLIVENKLGYTIGEKTSSKNIMLFKGAGIHYEKDIKYSLSVTLGITFASAQFNYTDTVKKNVFEKYYILQLPVTMVKYYMLSKNSNVFLQFGPIFSFLPLNKKEIFSNNVKQTVNTKTQGFNLGLSANIGVKTRITKNSWYLSVALSGYEDFFMANKNSLQKIKFNQFGLGFSFIKNFNE